MPIQILVPGKGGSNKNSLPSYFFRGKDEKFNRLLEFVLDVDQASMAYYTEDPEYGRELIDLGRNRMSITRLKDFCSPYMGELLKAASDKLSLDELEKMVWDASVPEPSTTNSQHENGCMITPIGIVTTDLHGFKGKVNTKATSDIYAVLIEGFTEEEIEDIRLKPKSDWENDTLEFNLSKDAWEAVVDEATFAAALEARVGKLELSVANFLTFASLEAVKELATQEPLSAVSEYLGHLCGKTVSVVRSKGGLLIDGVLV